MASAYSCALRCGLSRNRLVTAVTGSSSSLRSFTSTRWAEKKYDVVVVGECAVLRCCVERRWSAGRTGMALTLMFPFFLFNACSKRFIVLFSLVYYMVEFFYIVAIRLAPIL